MLINFIFLFFVFLWHVPCQFALNFGITNGNKKMTHLKGSRGHQIRVQYRGINFYNSDDHVTCDKVKWIAKAEIAAAKILVKEKERSVENLNYIIKLLKSTTESEVTNHCKQTESGSTPNAGLNSSSGCYIPIGPRAAPSRSQAGALPGSKSHLNQDTTTIASIRQYLGKRNHCRVQR